MGRIVELEELFEDDREFLSWGKKIEALLIDKHGISVLDHPNLPYLEWFEDDLTPAEVVEFIEEEIDV